MAQIDQGKTHPFPAFAPDLAEYKTGGAQEVLNVIPRADGWGPMPSLEIVTASLGAECLGGVYFKGADGNVTVFAATSTDLFRMSTSSTPYTWTNVSKSAAAYSVPAGERVAFLVYGNYVLVNNLGTTPQKYLIGTDSAFSDNTDMPQGRFMWRAGAYACVGNLNNAPADIACSGVADPTNWTVGSRGSDRQTIPSGGEVQGAVGTEGGAIIIMRDRMVFMTLRPTSGFTFTIDAANDVRGAASGLSIAQIGPADFVYYSEDGFFRGVQGDPIGAGAVDEWFRANVDTDNIADIRALVDPFEKIVWWKYPVITGGYSLIGWDWRLGRWTKSDADVTEALVLATSALTWDALDNLYTDIDTAMIPFDSRAFKGGRPAFAAFNSDNKMGFFSGAPLAATIDTGDIEKVPGVRFTANLARLIGNVATYTMTVGTKDTHSDSIRWRSPVSPSSASGLCPVFADGLLHRVRINIAEAEDWEVVSGVRMTGTYGGEI